VIMNAGEIQQVGTPLEVYNNPENAFVAAFMGSPAMNLVDGKYEAGHIHLEGGTKLEVTPPSRRILDEKGYDGRTVTFGIRPEDMRSEQWTLDATQETFVEPTIRTPETVDEPSITVSE